MKPKGKIHAFSNRVAKRSGVAETACRRLVLKAFTATESSKVSCLSCKLNLERFRHTDSYTRRISSRSVFGQARYRYSAFCTCGWKMEGYNWRKLVLKDLFIRHREERVSELSKRLKGL